MEKKDIIAEVSDILLIWSKRSVKLRAAFQAASANISAAKL